MVRAVHRLQGRESRGAAADAHGCRGIPAPVPGEAQVVRPRQDRGGSPVPLLHLRPLHQGTAVQVRLGGRRGLPCLLLRRAGRHPGLRDRGDTQVPHSGRPEPHHLRGRHGPHPRRPLRETGRVTKIDNRFIYLTLESIGNLTVCAELRIDKEMVGK